MYCKTISVANHEAEKSPKTKCKQYFGIPCIFNHLFLVKYTDAPTTAPVDNCSSATIGPLRQLAHWLVDSLSDGTFIKKCFFMDLEVGQNQPQYA